MWALHEAIVLLNTSPHAMLVLQNKTHKRSQYCGVNCAEQNPISLVPPATHLIFFRNQNNALHFSSVVRSRDKHLCISGDRLSNNKWDQSAVFCLQVLERRTPCWTIHETERSALVWCGEFVGDLCSGKHVRKLLNFGC